jgi:hypothetical protein
MPVRLVGNLVVFKQEVVTGKSAGLLLLSHSNTFFHESFHQKSLSFIKKPFYLMVFIKKLFREALPLLASAVKRQGYR